MIDNDQDIGFIAAAALRYALGRSSYIVPTVQDFIRRYKDNKIIRQNMPLYVRDINLYLENNTITDEYLYKSWANLLSELNQ